MGSFERGGGRWGARAGHSIWQAEAVICDIYSGWSWSAREGSKGL
jgi:phage terminase large subunit-like protein